MDAGLLERPAQDPRVGPLGQAPGTYATMPHEIDQNMRAKLLKCFHQMMKDNGDQDAFPSAMQAALARGRRKRPAKARNLFCQEAPPRQCNTM